MQSKRARTLTRGALLLALTSVAGCYGQRGVLVPDKKWVELIGDGYLDQIAEAPAAADAPPVACEVFLRLSHSRAGSVPGASHYELISPEVCVKERNGSFAFPGTIPLVYDPRDSAALGSDFGYCADGEHSVVVKVDRQSSEEGDDVVVDQTFVTQTKREKLQTQFGAEGKDTNIEVCSWNRRFRDAYPLDFELRSASGPLRDRVQLIQVFRNGALVFKAHASELDTDRVFIPGGRLSSDGLPHLSDFDLRVFPVGVEIDEDVLKQEVRERTERWHRRFEVAGKALATTDLGDGKTLAGETACLRWSIDQLNGQIAGLTGDSAPTKLSTNASAPAGCATHGPLGRSLLERYRELAGKGEAEAKQAAEQLLAEISKTLTEHGVAVKLDLGKIQDRLIKEHAAGCPKLKALCTAYTTLAALDADLAALAGAVDAGLQAIQETTLLAARLRDDALQVANDTKLQAKLFNQTVAALEEEGDVFDPYTSNPAATGFESILDMRYSDSFQWYFLGPWNGVAFRPDDGFDTQPSAAYLIPILDLTGFRVQWARGRLSELRVGTGIMYFEDADERVDAEGQAQDESEPRLAIQLNVALALMRIGVAYVPAAANGGRGALTDDNSHWRVVLGADLYKLITGNDLQAAGAEF